MAKFAIPPKATPRSDAYVRQELAKRDASEQTRFCWYEVDYLTAAELRPGTPFMGGTVYIISRNFVQVVNGPLEYVGPPWKFHLLRFLDWLR